MKLHPLILSFMLLCRLGICAEETKHWIVNYGKSLDYETFQPYSMIILNKNPSMMVVEVLREQGKQVFGHLSITEIDPKSRFYQMAQNKKLLIEGIKTPSAGNFVDVKNKEWVKMVIEEIIPYALFERYDGLVLDDIDSFLSMERKNPKEYEGSSTAIVRLIQTIRLNYPQLKLFMQNAYPLLTQVAADINGEIAESTYSQYNSTNKKYEQVPDQIAKDRLKALEKAKEINSSLEILSLDYWSADQPDEIKKIYKQQREHDFIPYVSTNDLTTIIPEPK